MNSSKIMTRAHAIRKADGVDMAAALRQAWLEAKINHIDTARFFLAMKDRWTNEDYAYDFRLETEQRALYARRAA